MLSNSIATGLPLSLANEWLPANTRRFTLDRRLQFNQHAASVASKGKRALGALYRTMGRLVGASVFGKLVQAKILPIFLYGIAVAAPSGRTYLTELEKLHRFAARLTLNNYQSSYSDLLYQLQWSSVAMTCFERRAMLAFKYIYQIRHLPGDCLQMAVHTGRYSERIMQRNVHQLQLYIPSYSRRMCDNFPIFEVFRVWNSLPEAAVNLDNFRSFKATVKSPLVFAMTQSRVPETVVMVDNL